LFPCDATLVTFVGYCNGGAVTVSGNAEKKKETTDHRDKNSFHFVYRNTALHRLLKHAYSKRLKAGSNRPAPKAGDLVSALFINCF
jgi:hypothetical protein